VTAAVYVTAVAAMDKLSDRDWHFLLPCIEVSQSVLCDQNAAECQHVKIRPSLLLQYGDTQASACSSNTPSLLLQYGDTQVCLQF